MAAQAIASWTLAGVAISVGIVDVWLAWQHGHDATVTSYVRQVVHKYPVIPFLLGLLAGHLFWGD